MNELISNYINFKYTFYEAKGVKFSFKQNLFSLRYIIIWYPKLLANVSVKFWKEV